jgi:hypothetical protein
VTRETEKEGSCSDADEAVFAALQYESDGGL